MSLSPGCWFNSPCLLLQRNAQGVYSSFSGLCLSRENKWVAWQLKLLVGHGKEVLFVSSGNQELGGGCAPRNSSTCKSLYQEASWCSLPVLLLCLSVCLSLPFLSVSDTPFLHSPTYVFLQASKQAKVLQSCQTLCNPMASFATCQALLSMGFSRQEYCIGLPFPPPGDLLDTGIKPVSLVSPELEGGFFTTSANWEAHVFLHSVLIEGLGNSLVVQWLGPCAFTADGPGLIPGWRTKLPLATWCSWKNEEGTIILKICIYLGSILLGAET